MQYLMSFEPQETDKASNNSRKKTVKCEAKHSKLSVPFNVMRLSETNGSWSRKKPFGSWNNNTTFLRFDVIQREIKLDNR